MYINTLIKIKNAQRARKETVRVPFTKMDAEILNILVRANYLKETVKRGRGMRKAIIATLQPAGKEINEVTLISKPSRRVYCGYNEIRPVKSGLGMSVLSTSKGILSGTEARRQKLGGELLFLIW